MAIQEHPAIGTVLMCDYETGFIVPEMVKRRPVVVVSPRIMDRPGLCTVVPLSTTAPEPIMQYHCQVDLPQQLPDWMTKNDVWVKGDLVAAVSYKRLDLIRLGKNVNGVRTYCFSTVTPETLKKIRRAVLGGLGLAQLTKHL